jgi:hypothetical protein
LWLDELKKELEIPDPWASIESISKRPTAVNAPSLEVLSRSQMPQHRPKAFVSHSTQDHAFVEKLATDLRANGVEAWYSGWEIKPGDSIRTKIEEGLTGCEQFIIVLSKNSINRPWVKIRVLLPEFHELKMKVLADFVLLLHIARAAAGALRS